MLDIGRQPQEWHKKCTSKGTGLGGQLEEGNLMAFSKAEGMGEKGKACQSHVGSAGVGQSPFNVLLLRSLTSF